MKGHITAKRDDAHKSRHSSQFTDAELRTGTENTAASVEPAERPSGGSGGLEIPQNSEPAETGTESEMVQTPCGCEEFDASALDVPEEGLLLACDTCGDEFGVYP